MTELIRLTHKLDLALADRAQHALCQRTVMPSGWTTPDEPMEIVLDALVPVDRADWERRRDAGDFDG